ncbi:MAG: hypothetical protein KIT54_11185 [Phycisphaeraceae bacterium]|nr:hypothetical protein [Phycisphaeraceae bacterium]
MRVIPKKLVEMLWFFANRAGPDGPWAADPAAIGLDAASVQAVYQAVQAMEAARSHAAQAQNAARAAMLDYHTKARALREVGSGAITRIKGTAAASGDSAAAVYAAARIPAPHKPGVGARPGIPGRFRVTLRADGTLDLAWDCDNGPARGVLYEVWRSTDGGPLAPWGVVGGKRLIDKTLPVGVGQVLYEVTATRVARGAPGGILRGRPVRHSVAVGSVPKPLAGGTQSPAGHAGSTAGPAGGTSGGTQSPAKDTRAKAAAGHTAAMGV